MEEEEEEEEEEKEEEEEEDSSPLPEVLPIDPPYPELFGQVTLLQLRSYHRSIGVNVPCPFTVELDYNVMKGTGYFMAL
jgi:hypothetical protein